MISGSAFQQLGTVIDEIEAEEMTVLDVMAERNSLVADGRLSVEITVGLDSLTSFGTTESVRIISAEADAEDDLVTTSFTVEIPVKEDSTEARETSDGSTRDSQLDSDGADRSLESKSDSPPEATSDEMDERDVETMKQISTENDEIPYYKNYDLLARVYEKHDTFAEMTEALGVDVTPATVREHMVNHGIHLSSSGGDEDTEADDENDDEDSDIESAEANVGSVTIEADGYGLPENVSMDSLVDAVHCSRTLYEVQRELELERSTAREILCDLNLLDMVTSRLADEGATDIDEVVDRIHSASTA